MSKKIEVALIKGNSRYKNILDSLELIKEDIVKQLKHKNKIIIKPNCVSDKIQAASTHVDAIKAVLDFISPYAKKIIIAEGSAYQTKTAFKNFNYYSLKENYNIDFIDLNHDEFEEIYCFNDQMEQMKIGIAKTMLNADCIISIALLKTHDSAIATFGIKNAAVGSLIKKTLFPYRLGNRLLRKAINRAAAIRNDKTKIHKGPKALNKNIFEIYKKIKPDISIIDAFEAMEGNGPIDGSLVKMELALAGTHALSVDMIAAKLIGLNPEDIGYLNYCINYENFNIKNIRIIGNTTIEKEKRKFKMHSTFKNQLSWH